MVFTMATEIERDLISKRTVEGLRAARAKGKLLGRPKGPGRSRLDTHRDEIIALLKHGSTQVYIAKRCGTAQPTLHNWLRQHKLQDIKPEYPKP
jgi:DNA invertase Pin-like site-specific DNA recombinase